MRSESIAELILWAAFVNFVIFISFSVFVLEECGT